MAEAAEKLEPSPGPAPSGSEVEIERLYMDVIMPCAPDPVSAKVLMMMLNGRETADYYASILRFDTHLMVSILNSVNALGLDLKIEDPGHAVSVLGIVQVRNIILGRSLYYRFFHKEDAKETPGIAEFAKFSIYGLKAEAVCKAIENPYLDLAYVGGAIFDLFRAKLMSLEQKAAGKDAKGDGKKGGAMAFFEDLWSRSIQAAIASSLLADGVGLQHKRFAFITGLLHNIGKLVLYVNDPEGYTALLDYIKTNNLSSPDEEVRRFGLDHAQVGALYIGYLKMLGDIEMAVDYHHGNTLLRFHNQPLYQFSGLIFTAAKMVRQIKDKDTLIRDEKDEFFKSEEYLCMKLPLATFIKIQKKYLKFKDIKGE